MLAPLFVAHCGHGRTTALNVLSAALDVDPRTAGTEVVFIDASERLQPVLSAATAQSRPVVVGWSFCSPDFARVSAELDRVRAAGTRSGVWHVAGGPHASAEPAGTLAAGFDLCASGEGETSVVELFAALREGRDPRCGPGLAFRDGARVVFGGPVPFRPLDDFPALNLRYRRVNAIELTRGCPFACSYCQTPLLFRLPHRHRSVENVVYHVAELRRLGVRYLRFIAPSALSYGATGCGTDLTQLASLLARVCETSGPHIKLYLGTFPSEVRPDHVTPSALELLRRYVRNRDLAIGVQSGSQRILDDMRRGYSVRDARRAVRVALAAGFRPQIDLMLGYPTETPAERAETLALAEQLGAWGAHIRCHAFMPLPGTRLHQARPEPIDAVSVSRLARLESSGVLHGPWRLQEQTARRLAAASAVQ
jgi:B12-binding domain/radical SAM domain protein